MWHKVSPIAFRIPYIRSWKSSWFATKRDYAKKLNLDVRLREYFKKQLSWIPTWDVMIVKKDDVVYVDIFTSKSALVLWAKWENIDRILKEIEKKFQIKVKINVKEVKKPEINAEIVAFEVASQIEKRFPYKRAIKQAIQRAMEKGAKWIKIKVWGRLNWAEIARKETFKDGNIPTQTIRAKIDYVSTRAETVYWTIWLKVWIYKWQVFKK